MIRTGIGFDAHRLVAGRRLVLGGVTMEYPLGLEGHSDADVLCHAVTDALLGAVAEGDIGRRFPDSDPQWKGACSLELLKTVAGELRARGVEVVNVDATLMAEQPKMAPHRAAMCECMAGALGVPVQRVSVKATTVEGMGAIGRREGIACMAVATVEERNAETPGHRRGRTPGRVARKG